MSGHTPWSHIQLKRAKKLVDKADARARAANVELTEAIAARRRARDQLAELVLEARAAGRTHVEIAKALDITPQGAKAIADRARRD